MELDGTNAPHKSAYLGFGQGGPALLSSHTDVLFTQLPEPASPCVQSDNKKRKRNYDVKHKQKINVIAELNLSIRTTNKRVTIWKMRRKKEKVAKKQQ